MKKVLVILVMLLVAATMDVAVAQFTQESASNAPKAKKQRVEPSVA